MNYLVSERRIRRTFSSHVLPMSSSKVVNMKVFLKLVLAPEDSKAR